MILIVFAQSSLHVCIIIPIQLIWLGVGSRNKFGKFAVRTETSWPYAGLNRVTGFYFSYALKIKNDKLSLRQLWRKTCL